MGAGKNISSDRISPSKNEIQNIPCYGGNGLRGYVDISNCRGERILIGRQGALCGNIIFVDGSFFATEHAVVSECREEIAPKFAFHLLAALDLNQYKSQGAQPGLAVSKLKRIEIPVPPLAEQQRIVDILDRFDELTTSLTDGLPAEIDARRQQYEYYRDKLLDFPRKASA